MKRFLSITIIALFAAVIPSILHASKMSGTIKGVVVYDAKSDFHIVETSKFYVIVEWYSGPDFSRGDIVYGDLHSYGYKMVNVNSNNKQTKIYIENYWGSKEKCFEWLREHNKL